MFDKTKDKIKNKIAKFSNFFKEGTAESMMRLATWICVIMGCGFPYYAHAIKSHIDFQDVTLALGMISVGITGKAYQKGKESKEDEAI